MNAHSDIKVPIPRRGEHQQIDYQAMMKAILANGPLEIGELQRRARGMYSDDFVAGNLMRSFRDMVKKGEATDNFGIARRVWKIGELPVKAPEMFHQDLAAVALPATPQPLLDALQKAAKAEPPRKPSVRENRMILDELDMAYDVRKVRYHGKDTDAAVADRLNVPRAWVRDLRVSLYGEKDTNEATEFDLAGAVEKLNAIVNEAKTRMDAHMTLAAKEEDLHRQAMTLLRDLTKRAS